MRTLSLIGSGVALQYAVEDSQGPHVRGTADQTLFEKGHHEPGRPAVCHHRKAPQAAGAVKAREPGSWIAASSRRTPPQFGHVKTSTRKTRRNNSAHEK